MSNYMFATVEDLQLSPALVLPSNVTVGYALQMAFEREFSILPLSDPSTRRLIGYLSADLLKSQVSSGSISDETALSELSDTAEKEGGGGEAAVRKFAKKREYEVITPETTLEELEAFFKKGENKGASFALVTDAARRFTLGVVTPEDLHKFSTRRNPNGATA